MADQTKYDSPLPTSDGKYQFPFDYNIYGQMVPVIEFSDMEDLIEKSIKLSETPEGLSSIYRRGSYGKPLMITTPERAREALTPTSDVIDATLKQSAMHMRALSAENKIGGLEASILYKPIVGLAGSFNIDESNLDNEKIMNWMNENGALDLAATNNPQGLAMQSLGSFKAKEMVLRSEAIKALYGRDLTESEFKLMEDAGLDSSAMMAVADYVKNGKDFDKAFGFMERMTWANWVRYNRRFFDPANITSMGIEIATDPMTFIPYGLAFKAPAFVSKTLGRAAATGLRQGSNQVARSFVGKGMRDFALGATIGGTQAYTYSSIRNWQGITEDTFSLTMGAMAFAGGLSFLGGRLSGGGMLDANKIARISSKQLDDGARILGDIGNEADTMARLSRDLTSDKPIEIYAFSENERLALGEIEQLKLRQGELQGEHDALAFAGLSNEPEAIQLRLEMDDVAKRIEALDEQFAKWAADERILSGEAIRKAETVDELRAAIPERDTDLRLATDKDLTAFQKNYKKLLSKIPSLTFAGTISKDARNWVTAYAAKLMPNESGWTAIDSKGNLVSATRLDKNLKDINDHVLNQVTNHIDEYDTRLKALAATGYKSIKEIQDDIHKFLITPVELNPKLDGRVLKVIEPIQEMTRIIGDMATDQKKVWGDGFMSVVNELGEQQLKEIEPLITALSHEKSHFIPAVVEVTKHHDSVQKIARDIQGYGSDNPAMHNEALKRAEQVAADQAATNLYAGVRNVPALFKKFADDKKRWWDIRKSQNPNWESPVDKAVASLKRRDDAITRITDDISTLKKEIQEAEAKNLGTKTREKNIAKKEAQIKKLQAEREALGAGDIALGTTAEEQVANRVFDKMLQEEAENVATGMINQHFETKHASTSRHGFDRPDHTEHRGSYWNYYHKARPDTLAIGDILDTRINMVSANYIKQMAGRLAGNEIFGAKTFREAMDAHGKWVSDNFQYERIGDLSRADQKLLKSFEGIIRGNYGITVRGQDYLGGSGMHAGGVEAILEVFKNFTGMTKNGFFWFYNMFEVGAGMHAYGADFVLKGNPLIRNRFTRALAGETPSHTEMRFVQNQMFADELMSLHSWNQILDNTKLKYGQKSLWGKLVAGSEYLYQQSPLTKMQRASQMAPEHRALNELTSEMVRFAHSKDYELGKKKWGGGFINETDIKRMGISADRLNGLMANLKKASYIDGEGKPRIKMDIFDGVLTPRDKSTISIMSNYIRDEIIQRSSFIDNFLYKGSSSSAFWDIMTQFKSFSMNSFRKKLVKSSNRVIYEGAYSETGIQFLLNAGLGTAMSQMKTVMRYNMLSDEQAKERFLELNYGVRSFNELDFSSPEPWMRAAYNGIMDSAWFAGVQMAASYFDARSMMQRTSGGNLQTALQAREGWTPQLNKFSDIITQNIPILGKANEVGSSANILLKYIFTPSKVNNVGNTRKDAQKFLKTFIPNEPFIISHIMNALGGKYD